MEEEDKNEISKLFNNTFKSLSYLSDSSSNSKTKVIKSNSDMLIIEGYTSSEDLCSSEKSLSS